MGKPYKQKGGEDSMSIAKRQEKEKLAVVDMLKKTPIVQIVCEKTGVSRATYYRWRKEDQEFARQTDDALTQGARLINDLAESQLISAIREKNLTAIIFWLKHHHPAYATKVELTTSPSQQDIVLTPEQEALVKKALELAGINKEMEVPNA